MTIPLPRNGTATEADRVDLCGGACGGLCDAEAWRTIKGFPWYQVSDHGRVRSVPRVTTRSNGVPLTVPGCLLQSAPNYGYPVVGIRREGHEESTSRAVHILVARAFLGDPLPGQEVRHLNSKRDDPRLVNLTYGSRGENNRDAVAFGTHHWASRVRCPRGHLLVGANLVPSKLRNGQRECTSCANARRKARGLIPANNGVMPDWHADADHRYALLGIEGPPLPPAPNRCHRGHEKRGPNLSGDQCRVCQSATSYVRRHPELTVQQEADRRYLLMVASGADLAPIERPALIGV